MGEELDNAGTNGTGVVHIPNYDDENHTLELRMASQTRNEEELRYSVSEYNATVIQYTFDLATTPSSYQLVYKDERIIDKFLVEIGQNTESAGDTYWFEMDVYFVFNCDKLLRSEQRIADATLNVGDNNLREVAGEGDLRAPRGADYIVRGCAPGNLTHCVAAAGETITIEVKDDTSLVDFYRIDLVGAVSDTSGTLQFTGIFNRGEHAMELTEEIEITSGDDFFNSVPQLTDMKDNFRGLSKLSFKCDQVGFSFSLFQTLITPYLDRTSTSAFVLNVPDTSGAPSELSLLHRSVMWSAMIILMLNKIVLS